MMRCVACALAALLLVAACAPVSEDECRAGDWYGLGQSSGRAGSETSRFDEVAAICAELGIQADAGAWLQGHEAGLRRYCTPRNAYNLARNGTRVTTSQCRLEEIGDMSFAADWGFAYYELNQRFLDLGKQISDLRNERGIIVATDPVRANSLTREITTLERRQSQLARERLRYSTLPF